MRNSVEKKEELAAFRSWLSSLSTAELVQAMQYEFIKDDNDHTTNGSGESHDFNLLKQLVSNQSPPPTPIHPRGVGYRPVATELGATDGIDEDRRVYKNRFTRPRLFQLMERRTIIPSVLRRKKPKARRFDVISRKKVTPEGDVLGVGSTQEQRDADKWILQNTLLYRDCQCCFNEASTSSTSELIRLLTIVSRGNLMAQPMPGGNTNRDDSNSNRMWAPWLNPTERWFSLSMFLSSHYEVALWLTFRGRVLPTLSTPIRDASLRLNRNAMLLVQQKAMAKTLQTVILPQDRDSFPMLLDGLLYHILNQGKTMVMSSLDFTPLLEFGTVRDKFCSLLRVKLEEECILEMQEALMSLDDDKPVKVKRKRTRKKKKRRAPAPKVTIVDPILKEEVDSSSDDTTSDHRVRFVPKPPPCIERSRKIFFVACILESVVEDVFVKVGLPPTIPPCVELVPKAKGAKKKATTSPKANTVAAAASRKEEVLSPNPFLSSEPSLPLAPSYNATNQKNAHDGVLSILNSNEEGALHPFHQHELDLDLFNHQSSPQVDVPWNMEDDQIDGWMNYTSREKSVFAPFFLKDESKAVIEDPRAILASSTAASIASSTDKEPDAVDDDPIGLSDADEDVPNDEAAVVVVDVDEPEAILTNSDSSIDIPPSIKVSGGSLDKGHASSPNLDREPFESHGETKSNSSSGDDQDLGTRSPSPPPPRTPSPKLSPILVSLADLKDMRERTPSVGQHRDLVQQWKKTQAGFVAGSLPNSPVITASNTIAPSWSRDDLRMNTSYTTDDQISRKTGGKLFSRRADAMLSYRNATVKPTPKSANGTRISQALGAESFVPVRGLSVPILDPGAHKRERDACARSETAVEHRGDHERWQTPKNAYAHVKNITTKMDEGTTVSALSPAREPEEMVVMRDERNTFRDMCLTLGADVAKMANILAAQKGTHMHHGPEYFAAHSPAYSPEFMQPHFKGITRATTTIGAMSDAGMPRGDHDSAFSEDGTDHATDQSGRPRSVSIRRLSSGALTTAGSDLSLDQNFGSQQAMPNIASIIPPPSNAAFGTDLVSGVHSRLTKDIIEFLNANRVQLQNDDTRRTAAIQRLSRLVTAVWPRAQVKLYGSHVTGLSLPSSDLDFVVCLPAVHKNAPAITPGVLEGRNAVNESSQKLLARRLKGESWIDPRSIKIIERTVVPVIKVSTKDARTRMLQLDISFDGPVHHGLEAIAMVKDILQQFPMVRPLVLVLKQFLFDRGLLTAYTGGLSSYGLFLMVTRFLQEQPNSWGDCGSMLMGFLDFYGNCFDPRSTGISVGRRQYFARRTPMPPPVVYQPPMVVAPIPTPVASPQAGRPNFLRRHSFTDRGNNGETNWSRPPRHLPQPAPLHPRFVAPPPYNNNNNIHIHDRSSGKSYTFDPLWVEDPLSAGNNVGRNAFRIFQVQRAFSDAHRALVASLEWESVSNVHTEVVDYPLLKCLLQSEDVFYDLDDHHR